LAVSLGSYNRTQTEAPRQAAAVEDRANWGLVELLGLARLLRMK
jgi:hypothetical protein